MSFWDYIFVPRKEVHITYTDLEDNHLLSDFTFAMPKVGNKFYFEKQVYEVVSISEKSPVIFRVAIQLY